MKRLTPTGDDFGDDLANGTCADMGGYRLPAHGVCRDNHLLILALSDLAKVDAGGSNPLSRFEMIGVSDSPSAEHNEGDELGDE